MLSKRIRQNELLSAYVEPLASGRRVVVLGDGAAALGEKLVQLGARAVHAYVTGPSPELRTAPGVVIKRLIAQDDLDVRDGSFDIAIVPDADTLADAEGALVRARRLVGPAGVVVVGAPADGSLGYYELYDLVSAHFTEIAMVGQVPFSGAALAVLGEEGEPEVTVDTQLAGDASPPTHFLAIASESPIDIRPYVILQLPNSELANEEEVEEDQAPTRRLQDLLSERDALAQRNIAAERQAAATAAAQASERAASAEARLRAEQLEAQLHEQRARVQASIDAVRSLEQELARRDEQARILVQTARAAEETADALRARLEDAGHHLLTRDEHLARVLARAADLEQLAARAVELESIVALHRDLEQTAVDAQQASMAAEALEAELIELAEGHAAEVATLEQALRNRGRTINALERELARRARMIQELLIELDQRALAARHEPVVHVQADTPSRIASNAGPRDAGELERLANDAARLRSTLEALANAAARREGELQALRWRIEELELQRAATPASEPTTQRDHSSERMDELRDEVDMLRQALRQEHEARLRAEAGDALVSARAEIERQAVLLEQLRAQGRSIDEQEDASATG